MPSVAQQLVAAVVAALDGAGKPATLTVHTRRALPLTEDDLPATVVYAVEEEAQRDGTARGAHLDRVLTLRLEHRIAGTPTDDMDALMDPLRVWATAALMADRRWGALATDTVEVRTQWSQVTQDKAYLAAAQDFRLTFTTPAGDATTAIP